MTLCPVSVLDRNDRRALLFAFRSVSVPPLPSPPAAIKVDKENMDYNKLRVKQLKGILADRGVDCDGCLEKSDYVARCKATEHLEL